MVETIGICEKHQLPLDEHGECELCRLSMVPSNAPPTPSAWWALIIPLVLLGAGIVWALSSLGSEPEVSPQRGVRTTEPRPSVPDPVRPTPSEPEPEPEIPPTSPEPPVPPPNIPTEDIPIPQPPEDETPEGRRLDEVPRAPATPAAQRDL